MACNNNHTLGATTDTCQGRMRQMHVVCTSNKAHKVAFGIQSQALWHALCLCVGEQSHPLSVKGSFVVFIPSADHMCLLHVTSACIACCPRCDHESSTSSQSESEFPPPQSTNNYLSGSPPTFSIAKSQHDLLLHELPNHPELCTKSGFVTRTS
jgi:hypothetical protein